MMRTEVVKIPDPYYPDPMVIEHTSLDEVSRVFLAHVRAGGLSASSPRIREAHGKLMEVATLAKLSTWGEVLRIEGAEVLLRMALEDLGLDGIRLPDDRVLH